MNSTTLPFFQTSKSFQVHWTRTRGINVLRAAFFHHSKTMPAKLSVQPVSSLVDEKNFISLTGLKKEQPVTFYAQLKGDDNTLFHSHAHYIANESGCISLSEETSHGGSYTGIHSMGLLWGLELGPNEKKGCRLLKKDVTTPYEIKLKALRGHLPKEECTNSYKAEDNFLSECIFQKWYMRSNVQRIPVREGRIRGTFFLPPGDGPFPGILQLVGGGGLVEFRASLFASHGFASLALAYFRYEDLPPTHFDLDMEYFEEAVKWMCKHPKIQPGIGVEGISIGACIGLVLASLRSEVSAVAAIGAPHGIFWKGLSYGVKILKHIDLDFDKVTVNRENVSRFRDCLTDMSDEVGIALESIKGEILLVFGEDDQCFDIDAHKKTMEERLIKHGKNFTTLSYPNAGHIIEPPYTPLCPMSYHPPAKTYMSWGGEPAAHARAQEDYWGKVMKFFRMNVPNRG